MLEHILEALIKAGWVLIPLLLASGYGWFLVVHRFLALTRLELPGAAKLRHLLFEPDWETRVAKLTEHFLVGKNLPSVFASEHEQISHERRLFNQIQ